MICHLVSDMWIIRDEHNGLNAAGRFSFQRHSDVRMAHPGSMNAYKPHRREGRLGKEENRKVVEVGQGA